MPAPPSAARERLQPSLLDRLLDDDRDLTREAADRQTLTNAQLRAAVLRDLTALLNTTRLESTVDLAGLPHVAASTVNYGIPPLTGSAAGADTAGRLQAAVLAAIRRYEPRILPDTLRVRVRAPGTPGAAHVVLDIEGSLWAQPAPQSLFLQTAIELDGHSVTVGEASRR